MRVDSGTQPRISTPARPEPKPAETANTATAKEPLQVKDGFDTSKAAPTGVATQAAPAKAALKDVASALGAGLTAAATPPTVPQAALDKLPEADRTRVQQAAQGTQGASAQGNLDTLVKSSGFQGLSADNQAKALQSFLAGPPTSATSTQQLTALTGNANFRSLSAADQAKALDVFQNTSLDGRQHLIDLTNRQVNGHSALLDTDKNGNTLLSSLQSMATGPLASELTNNGVTRADLLSSVMEEASNPGQINQSNRNTCTVTSMQYMLNQQNPAEYVRIMQGLSSPEGSVQLRNGATITRDPNSAAPDSATDRSASERLFQSAMMEYANGDHNYDNVTDRNTGKESSWVFFEKDVDPYPGLYRDQEERGLEALFGRDFKVYDGSFNFTDDKQDILNELQGRSGQRTLMDLQWGDGGHAVVFEKVENGRVYFRNPWGPTGDATGTNYDNPPRRLEDGANRVESMSVEDFKKYVRQIYLPN